MDSTNIANSELLCVKLRVSNCAICIVYRPPDLNIQDSMLLNEKINSLSLMFPNFCLLGDFNFPDIDWSIGMARSEVSKLFF